MQTFKVALLEEKKRLEEIIAKAKSEKKKQRRGYKPYANLKLWDLYYFVTISRKKVHFGIII